MVASTHMSHTVMEESRDFLLDRLRLVIHSSLQPTPAPLLVLVACHWGKATAGEGGYLWGAKRGCACRLTRPYVSRITKTRCPEEISLRLPIPPGLLNAHDYFCQSKRLYSFVIFLLIHLNILQVGNFLEVESNKGHSHYI
jgi:hypothetical protein